MSRAHFQTLADNWAAAGEPPELLIDGHLELIAFVWWTLSDGAYKEGVPDSVMRFADACAVRMDTEDPGQLHQLLWERHHCERCGTRYMLQNLLLCSVCRRMVCFWCHDGKASNGNYACFCCEGEYVLLDSGEEEEED